jgi:ribonucleoside-diphosphate reductase alpha chain
MIQTKMRVKKRDGTLVLVRLDEITDRISSLSKDLDEKIIDPVKITLEVVEKIHDGISTSHIDSFTAEICHSKSIEHPHFNILASRLIIGDHQKTIQIIANLKYSQVCQLLYTNTDQLGELCPIISEELFSMSQEHKDIIDNMIDNERDFLLDYFGFKTLAKSYLLKVANKVVETPQHMFMRVALGIHGKLKFETGTSDLNFELVKETYDLLSLKYFTHATPTLYNSGTRRPQLFSCFLMNVADSLKSIFKVLGDCADISKWSGGIGLPIHDIRGNKAYIRGTGGHSDGIVPMLKVYNDTARYINQGGKRSGSFAIYIEPWHSDILDFLKCKLPHGDENRRARDLFYALWIPDLFMERVKANESWSLMCPSECPGLANVYGKDFKKLYEKYEKEGRVVKTINAQDLFHEIVKSQIETGTPYMTYKDSVNHKTNQKNIGTITSSNLCVAPETRILTNRGYLQIKDLKDKKVSVWNGSEWSVTTVRQTGIDQKLIKVTLSNGSVINCTEYHKFITEVGSRPAHKSVEQIVEAKNLKEGMKLIKHNLPIINTEIKQLKYPYTHGLFCSAKYGPINQLKQPKIELYGPKKDLLKYIDIRTTSGEITEKDSINVMLPFDISEKFEVPINYCLESKLKWFEGVCDGDGTIAKNGMNESIQITSINKNYLIDIQLMLQTIGINSKVNINKEARIELLPDGKRSLKEYDCKEIYRLLITSVGTQKLLDLGFNPKRLKIKQREIQRDAEQFIRVISIEDKGRIDNTYCFTEPLKNRGMFEGVLIGNCAEIMEYSDTKKYACCVLASMVLPTYVVMSPITKESKEQHLIFDHAKLAEVVKIVTRNLNKLIDINYYSVEETRTSNMSERPIGIGIQGLADVFYKLELPYDSEEALKLDREIAETIYYAALSTSLELSKKDGPYATFKGSPISKGHFQFDLWKEFPTSKDHIPEIIHSGRYDWEKLRKEIKKHGVRNSLVSAYMPTASTSQIMGSASEGFEPITSNCYTRRVKAGEFMVINPYMAADLIKVGLWNEGMRNKLIQSRGSIQDFKEIPQKLKDIYKTVWELQQKVLIDHSVARGPYIDQSQSLNLYFGTADPEKITKAHFYGWSKGLKTGSYYIRSKSAINSASFTLEQKEEPEKLEKTEKSPSKKSPVVEIADDSCTSCGS